MRSRTRRCSRRCDFNGRNPDFLSRNPDFLSRNPDFLSRNPDFLSRNPDFLLKNVEFYIITQAGRVKAEALKLELGKAEKQIAERQAEVRFVFKMMISY